jgi:hypothetical protein
MPRADDEQDFNTLADTYLRHHSEHRDEDSWVLQEVDRVVRANLTLGWQITLLLLRKADSDDALRYVAAGPLEDLVDGYGDAALDIIEPACDSDPQLQFALSGIWLLPDSRVLARFRALMTKYGFYDKRQPLSRHPDC